MTHAFRRGGGLGGRSPPTVIKVSSDYNSNNDFLSGFHSSNRNMRFALFFSRGKAVTPYDIIVRPSYPLKSHGDLLAVLSSIPRVTIDAELLKKRIWNIITRRHSGIFTHLLPEYYNEQYGEALPLNWETIIEDRADINREKGVGNSMILCQVSSNSKVIYNTHVFHSFQRNYIFLFSNIQIHCRYLRWLFGK